MSIAKNTREPELQDFGITPEEYALHKNNGPPRHFHDVAWTTFGIPLVVVIVVSAATQDILEGILWGIVGVIPSFVVSVVVSGVAETFVWNRARDELLESPVASKIKLYEDAKAAHDTMREEAERMRQEEEKAQREAEKARRKVETARLKVERARRRKLEGYWMSLSGTDFEREMANVLRALGYRVKSTPSSGDEGVDLILKRPGKTIVVQCKAHQNPVGPAIARELFGSMIHFKADRAILACTGGFTRGVKEFVRDKPIDLVSVSELARLGAQVEGKDIQDTPMCTKCARAMVLKEGSYGKFWGCPGYPRCRETRDEDEW